MSVNKEVITEAEMVLNMWGPAAWAASAASRVAQGIGKAAKAAGKVGLLAGAAAADVGLGMASSGTYTGTSIALGGKGAPLTQLALKHLFGDKAAKHVEEGDAKSKKGDHEGASNSYAKALHSVAKRSIAERKTPKELRELGDRTRAARAAKGMEDHYAKGKVM